MTRVWKNARSLLRPTAGEPGAASKTGESALCIGDASEGGRSIGGVSDGEAVGDGGIDGAGDDVAAGDTEPEPPTDVTPPNQGDPPI